MENFFHPKWLSQWTFYNNSLDMWAIALSVQFIITGVLYLVRNIVARRLARFEETHPHGWIGNGFGHLIVSLVQSTKLFFLFSIGLEFSILFLKLPKEFTKILVKAPFLALLIQSAIWGIQLLDYFINHYVNSRVDADEQKLTQTMMIPVRWIGKLVLLALLLLLFLDNLGMNVSALIAGLGITGVAVALAVQNILGDLLASISLVVDKPFVIGDFIIVDSFVGTVEHMGLKTTRLRSLTGEQIIFSNADILKSRIRNYKRMSERRITFLLLIDYQTPPETLKEIPSFVQKTIESIDLTRFDRSHFLEFTDIALKFETVYYVLSPEYNTYMDIQQTINLQILEGFKTMGVEFAHPLPAVFPKTN